MTEKLFLEICKEAFLQFRYHVPYTPNDVVKPNGKIRRRSTGNMRFNSVKVEYKLLKNQGFSSTIKVDSGIAPYAVYTNEPWVSDTWNGAKNPNEGWVERAVYDVVKRIAAKYGGIITKE